MTDKRNYLMVEKTDEGIFLVEGKGTPSLEEYDETKHWNEWEKMEDQNELFSRIAAILDK